MEFAFLETLALRETGRLALPVDRRRKRRLIVYPEALTYRRPLLQPYAEVTPPSYYLSYGNRGGNGGTGLLRFIIDLLQLLPGSNRIDIFIFSRVQDMKYVRSVAVLARLVGISATLHDYSHRSTRPSASVQRLHALCGQVEIGDSAVLKDNEDIQGGFIYRSGLFDRDRFEATARSSAVPVVAVCGDFESRRMVSLARRTHDLIKQKYPRTEFLLLSVMAGNETDPVYQEEARSFRVVKPKSQEDVRSLYEKADILMILTPGGLNRDWLVRAYAAGYPVIVNGSIYDEAEQRIISVPRDSYTGLAEAVIRLVDDEAYYRSFSR